MVKRKRTEASDHKVILVIGAANLDRLLTIPKFPAPDAKIRSTDYNEVCGGNAANSASAIARLVDAKCWKQKQDKKKVVVKLLTKIGNDQVGKRVMEQLQDSNVDLSSPLFKIGSLGSTTSVCTILVDSEVHTRTCIFTYGTCGELTVEDVRSVNLDDLFENVIHLHSDARHADAALALAQEAKNRGIPVSLDCEKDRKNASFEKLLEISDMVFLNSSCLHLYLNRLEPELEENQSASSLEKPKLLQNSGVVDNVSLLDCSLDEETTQIYIKSLRPVSFLHRWYPNPKRQCIVTHGSMGALHFQAVETKEEKKPDTLKNKNCTPALTIKVAQDDGSIRLQDTYRNTRLAFRQDHYHMNQIGVLKNVNVVDTTGAGDAFVGAFLLATYAGGGGLGGDCDVVQDAMKFATWVSGKKLEGVGAQSALPRAADVDQQLGMHWNGVVERLQSLLGRQFNGIFEG